MPEQQYSSASHDEDRAALMDATKSQIIAAGWLVPCYIAAGGFIGWQCSKDMQTATILLCLGAAIGMLLGFANLTRRKVEALTARQISAYIASRQD